jgi:hypothetical protein
MVLRYGLPPPSRPEYNHSTGRCNAVVGRCWAVHGPTLSDNGQIIPGGPCPTTLAVGQDAVLSGIGMDRAAGRSRPPGSSRGAGAADADGAR